MRTFEYFLFRSRLNLMLGLLLGVMFLLACLKDPLYSDAQREIRKVQYPGQQPFQFMAHTETLLPKYNRKEYQEDLQRYLSWIRNEQGQLPSEPEDETGKVWLQYLRIQQEAQEARLRSVTGISDPELYYFSQYLEPFRLSLLSMADQNFLTDPMAETDWNELIEQGLVSPSAILRSAALNIRDRLPLRMDNNSASSILLAVRHTVKPFLLLLIPFLAVLVLMEVPDRNLRRETALLSLKRLSAVFLWSALAYLSLMLMTWLALRLFFGDAEGAMHILPAWNMTDPMQIRTLSEFLRELLGLDLAFLLFASAWFLALLRLTGELWSAAAISALSMILPSIGTFWEGTEAGTRTLLSPALFTPFHYFLRDDRVLTGFSAGPNTVLGGPASCYALSSGQVLSVLLTGTVLAALLQFVAGRWRRNRTERLHMGTNRNV